MSRIFLPSGFTTKLIKSKLVPRGTIQIVINKHDMQRYRDAQRYSDIPTGIRKPRQDKHSKKGDSKGDNKDDGLPPIIMGGFYLL